MPDFPIEIDPWAISYESGPPDNSPEIQLTPEQRQAADALVLGICQGKQVQTLGGYAGTGKSTLIKSLVKRVPGVAVCAPTGKAADVLRRKGIHDASTIHGLIYRPIETEVFDEKLKRRVMQVSFEHVGGIVLSGIIVDEASMVGRQVYEDLLRFQLPVVFIGDHGQLEPVESSNFNLMADPQYRLETIHRNAGEIARFADHLRQGRRSDGFRREAGGQVELVTARQIGVENLPLKTDQMICAFNKTRVKVNGIIRDALGREGPLPGVGERVMCLRNDRQHGVFNGQQGVVTRLDSRTLDFEAEGEVHQGIPYHPDQFGKESTLPRDAHDEGQSRDGRIPFDYAYCITCHKSQGDEFDSVLVLEERCRHWDHNRWAYSAATRAREKLYWANDFRF
jgi:exodeoxyribonuclease-5